MSIDSGILIEYDLKIDFDKISSFFEQNKHEEVIFY